MRNRFVGVTLVATSLLACGGSTRNQNRADATADEDAGTWPPAMADDDPRPSGTGGRSPSMTPASGSAGAGLGGTPGGPDPNAGPPTTCPDVFADPVSRDPAWEGPDDGAVGLRELRRRVLESRDRWEQTKTIIGDTYSYTRRFESFFGFGCETTVVVHGGVVTSRAASQGSDLDDEPLLSAVVETRSEVGAEPGCYGHPPLTLDALYDSCLEVTLCQDPRDNYLYVSFDAEGILAECGYFPINCFDDCYEGLERITLRLGDAARDCCPISPEPDCCMDYGGAGDSCGTACDGMPWPGDGWRRAIDEYGCPHWIEPAEAIGCCGCEVDAGTE